MEMLKKHLSKELVIAKGTTITDATTLQDAVKTALEMSMKDDYFKIYGITIVATIVGTYAAPTATATKDVKIKVMKGNISLYEGKEITIKVRLENDAEEMKRKLSMSMASVKDAIAELKKTYGMLANAAELPSGAILVATDLRSSTANATGNKKFMTTEEVKIMIKASATLTTTAMEKTFVVKSKNQATGQKYEMEIKLFVKTV